MRIVRYEKDWRSHWGIVDGDTIYELLGDVYGEAWSGNAVGKWGELKVLAPCVPETVWSNGANYPSRCDERGFEYPRAPQVAWTPGTMVCGTDVEVGIPEFEKRSEYGAELGVVLRKDCYQVEESEADEYILGYTVLNNIWIKDRDGEEAHVRPLRVYDNHCPTGPVINTEMDWRHKRIRLWVDGQLRQDDNTSSMFFSPQLLVSWTSKIVSMKRGDLLMTGTPGGVEGHVLHYGEIVEIEIEDIGRLRNRIVRVDNGAVTYIVAAASRVEMLRSGADDRPSSFA